MTEEDLEFIEKVKLPEYEGYGWGNATKIIRDLMVEVRELWAEKAERQAAIKNIDEA